MYRACVKDKYKKINKMKKINNKISFTAVNMKIYSLSIYK